MIAQVITEKKSSSSRTKFTIKPELLIIWIKFISCESIERLLRLLGSEYKNRLTYQKAPANDTIINYRYSTYRIIMSSDFRIESALKMDLQPEQVRGSLLFFVLDLNVKNFIMPIRHDIITANTIIRDIPSLFAFVFCLFSRGFLFFVP